MALNYGFVKCKVVSEPVLKLSRHKQEIQYHLHANLRDWDTAINVGTNDADDLPRFKLAFDYHNPLLDAKA